MTDAHRQAGRVYLRIVGRVQGVGFRFSAMDEARRLGLSGWVRNTHDGSVELVAEGDPAALRLLVIWCQTGPRGAFVVEVKQEWLPYNGEFDDFQIKH